MSRSAIRRPVLGLILAVLIVLAAFSLRGLLDQDLERRTSEAFPFSNGSTRLAGTLWLPDRRPPQAAIVLVHGDGPQDRTSDNGYAPLINSLLDAGIAVASWDKPGIGASTGDWLAQSMQDRADETAAALAALRQRLPHITTGALGFSQAGWVLPKLRAPQADLLVLAGPAVSWIDQGRYFGIVRRLREGMGRAAAEREADLQAEQDTADFGPAAGADAARRTGLGAARYAFIRRNLFADATNDLSALDIPILAVWGEDDLNVDAPAEWRRYRTLLANRTNANVVLVPNATHGLLRTDPYNAQLTSEWPLIRVARFLIEGRRAYASSALSTITAFILSHSPVQSGIPRS